MKNYYYNLRTDILNSFFESNERTVFSEIAIQKIQDHLAISLKMASYSFPKFQKFLTSNNFLIELNFEITSPPSTKRVYTSQYFHEKSEYDKFIEVFHTIYPKGYFTHYTAMRYYKLTDQLPKSIYINNEQQSISKESINYEKGHLTQSSIDTALQKKIRIRNSTLSLFNHVGFKISGKNTKNIGTTSVYIGGIKVKITSIERTLVDIIVHQEFSGGSGEVFNAYLKTYKLYNMGEINFSINKLIRILKKLNYIYPYYQSIGFLLEKVGFDTSKFKKEFKINHKFYLIREKPIEELQYIEDWKLYIPKNLNQFF